MTVGVTPRQADVFRSTTGFVGDAVADDSVWSVLHRECHVLFPDEAFADLFQATGRRSVPPRIVAVVMVLQRFLGMSDREAVSAFQFDARWKYACGGLDFDYPGFAHTVLVDMRSRLARSAAPDRIFEVTLGVAREAGLVGLKRVMDSAPIYDAVSTQDTVTMIRSAIRGLLKAASSGLGGELRAVLVRDDDYTAAGKPVCDWDDPHDRTVLVDALAVDALACLDLLDGQELTGPVTQAAGLLATVVGQDLETDDDGRFVIAWRVAKDRVISTVDPDARHGHKTAARSFDGYKGHIAEDPDSEIITATIVTPGNVGDAAVANGNQEVFAAHRRQTQHAVGGFFQGVSPCIQCRWGKGSVRHVTGHARWFAQQHIQGHIDRICAEQVIADNQLPLFGGRAQDGKGAAFAFAQGGKGRQVGGQNRQHIAFL